MPAGETMKEEVYIEHWVDTHMLVDTPADTAAPADTAEPVDTAELGDIVELADIAELVDIVELVDTAEPGDIDWAVSVRSTDIGAADNHNLVEGAVLADAPGHHIVPLDMERNSLPACQGCRDSATCFSGLLNLYNFLIGDFE